MVAVLRRQSHPIIINQSIKSDLLDNFQTETLLKCRSVTEKKAGEIGTRTQCLMPDTRHRVFKTETKWLKIQPNKTKPLELLTWNFFTLMSASVTGTHGSCEQRQYCHLLQFRLALKFFHCCYAALVPRFLSEWTGRTQPKLEADVRGYY
jgi:hypothetical protein